MKFGTCLSLKNEGFWRTGVNRTFDCETREEALEQTTQNLLVGTWRGVSTQSIAPIEIVTALNLDMSFTTTMRSLGGTIITSGAYKILNGNIIEYTNSKKWSDPPTLTGPLSNNLWGILDGRTARDVVLNVPDIADKNTAYFRFLDENTVEIATAVPGTIPVVFRRDAIPAGPFDPFANSPLNAPRGRKPVLSETRVRPRLSQEQILVIIALLIFVGMALGSLFSFFNIH